MICLKFFNSMKVLTITKNFATKTTTTTSVAGRVEYRVLLNISKQSWPALVQMNRFPQNFSNVTLMILIKIS